MMSFHKKDKAKHILSEIATRMKTSDRVKIITGFATKSGLKELVDSVGKDQFEEKVQYFLVGIPTEPGYNALASYYPSFKRKDIFRCGTDFLWTGHGHSVRKVEPTIHAKLIVGESDGVNEWAYVGSSNVTRLALRDDNFEGSILLDADKSNKSTLIEISTYMDNIKDGHSEVFRPKPSRVLFRPTGDGEFTVVVEGMFIDLERTFLAPLLASKEGLFDDGRRSHLVLSDLLEETGFTNYMKTRDQVIAVLIFDSLLSLARGDFSVKPGTVTMSNNSEIGQDASLLRTSGYLNHFRYFPFIYQTRRPSVVSSGKTSQVHFRLYSNLDEMKKEVGLETNQEKFFRLLGGDNKDLRREIIDNIFMKQRYEPFVTPIDVEERGNPEVYRMVRVVVENIERPVFDTFGSRYRGILEEFRGRGLDFQHFLGVMKRTDMSKEEIQQEILSELYELKVESLIDFKWRFGFNKMLRSGRLNEEFESEPNDERAEDLH